ncbi:MAG: flagellar M-ring protein FliF, partial [Spirochaetaceae bacterium]
MNEWLKRVLEQIKALWQKINLTQRIIMFSIAGVVLVAVIMLFAFSASPSRPALFRAPITDENALFRITQRLDQENIPYTVTEGIV